MTRLCWRILGFLRRTKPNEQLRACLSIEGLRRIDTAHDDKMDLSDEVFYAAPSFRPALTERRPCFSSVRTPPLDSPPPPCDPRPWAPPAVRASPPCAATACEAPSAACSAVPQSHDVNVKRVYRFYLEEGLMGRRKRQKRLVRKPMA
jgi:hypothetical protein